MLNSVLADPGWIEFIENKHELNHRVLKAGTEGTDTAYAEILVFLNKHGKLRNPRLVPYMPLYVQFTQTTSKTKLQRQWLTLGNDLSQQMSVIGYGGNISLDPDTTDVRPWQWAGLDAQVRYTMTIPLPSNESDYSHSTRKQIKKAERAGYTVELTDDVDAVVSCLLATEERQSFGYGISAADLKFLSQHMVDGTFRMYIARNADGSPASSRVVLAPVGGTAIDLVAGTMTDDLRNGVTQLTIARVLADLANHGVMRFDYGGANIESVAASKMEWGVELTPFYTLSSVGVRSLAIHGKRWLTRKVREVRR